MGAYTFLTIGGQLFLIKRFDVEDDHYFADYIEAEFIHRSEIPEMNFICSESVVHSDSDDNLRNPLHLF